MSTPNDSQRGATSQRMPIAVFVSGSGTTLENLIERSADGRMPHARIVGVLSSRSTVRAVQIARSAALPLEIVRRKDYSSDASFSDAISAAADAFQADLIVFAGFLCHWQLPRRYAKCTINIHPALLPAFGGRGMYGRRVHEAVLAARQSESGCTVHLVDEQYDHGPILAQQRVPVHGDDTPDTLAARVAGAERELYPEVIEAIATRGMNSLLSHHA